MNAAEETFNINDIIHVTDLDKIKPVAQIGGYEYKWSHIARSTGQHYWRCQNYSSKNGKCMAILYTDGKIEGSRVTAIKREHNHVPDPLQIEKRIVRSTARTIVKTNPQLPVRHVLAQATANASNAFHMLGVRQNLGRMMRHHRQHARVEPPLPTGYNFEIPIEYQTLDNGSAFIIHDSADHFHDGRIIILGSEGTVQILSEADRIGGDGSFKKIPAEFMQFFGIHAVVDQSFKLCVVILMTFRTVDYYRYALQKLKEYAPFLNPHLITLNFEQAAIAAFKAEFPEIRIEGSFFHLGQIVYKNVVDKDMKVKYSQDSNFAIHCKMIAALAFLPPEHIIFGFNFLSNEMRGQFDIPEVIELLDYFEDNFIGRPDGNGGRREPRYPIAYWSVSQRVVSDQLRIENSYETWHRAINVSIRSDHPSIWKFLEVMKEEFILTMGVVAGAVDRLNAQKQKHVRISEQLRRFQEEFFAGKIALNQFLQKCATVISFYGV